MCSGYTSSSSSSSSVVVVVVAVVVVVVVVVFFDIRVFDPVAPSHAHQSLDAAHSKQENEKRRQYEDRILHVEHASFTPLVFTIAGGMSNCTKKFFSRRGEMLAEKRLQPKSIVSSRIRCMVSFSLSCDLRQDAYEAQDTEKKLPPTSNTSIYSNRLLWDN